MRLLTSTDYALRVLIHLATAPTGHATVTEIAEAYGISRNTLVKVVNGLGHVGLVNTARGSGGGVRLGKPAEEIDIGTVVQLMEGTDVLAECFDPAGHGCVIARSCRLPAVLGEAARAFHAVLARHTLADMVRDREPLVAILHPAGAAAKGSCCGGCGG
ncbi:Rrf2 family transcriptional regulator [Usitatibacter palustris]|uniref:HTH-type transcriptional repressor NsrR n=1 Tax=Usitatibacter palustris TaxID=2732487 RepID=A0A6M4H6I8_9PROT|nr:Rrf2 family transcriptional regulator [Usitatibacter palustris]QJR14273.1 HTH-type transcriptional repressor NsrR [Usitatibacter palustris]